MPLFRIAPLALLCCSVLCAGAGQPQPADMPPSYMRVRELIDRIPATQPATRPIDDSPWSKPVSGLIARIDLIDWDIDTLDALLVVRLKNVSGRPMLVPAGVQAVPLQFTLHRQLGDGPWEKVSSKWSVISLPLNPMITLPPGQSAVAWLHGDAEAIARASRIKVVVSPYQFQPGEWTDALETPPHPALPRRDWLPVPRPLSLPDHFGEFDPAPPGPSSFVGEERLERIEKLNARLASMLRLYDPEAVAVELDRRAREPREEPMRLYLTALSAAHGSRPAALRLLEMSRSVQEETVREAARAIRIVLTYAPADPPDWAVEMAIAILADHRSLMRVGAEASDVGMDLVSILGRLKCRSDVPVLAERLQSDVDEWVFRNVVADLEQIGDRAAIRALVDHLARIKAGQAQGEERDRQTVVVDALARLKVREVVPDLLARLDELAAIRALGEIGDARALQPLRELIRNDGRIIREDKRITPGLEEARVIAAEAAAMRLQNVDPVRHQCEQLLDQTRSRRYRWTVLEQLLPTRDPRAIPALLRFVQNDPLDPYTLDIIDALPEFKDKAAIDALIECLALADGLRGEKEDVEKYRERTTASLRRLSRRPINSTAADWRAWWQEARDTYRIPDSR